MGRLDFEFSCNGYATAADPFSRDVEMDLITKGLTQQVRRAADGGDPALKTNVFPYILIQSLVRLSK